MFSEHLEIKQNIKKSVLWHSLAIDAKNCLLNVAQKAKCKCAVVSSSSCLLIDIVAATWPSC